MLTKSDIATILKNNLADNRIFATQLFIDNTIKRKQYGSGIDQYRMKNTVLNSTVTTFQQFVDGITGDHLSVEYPYAGEKLSGDRVTGFLVTVNNMEVVFNDAAVSDVGYSAFLDFFGKGARGFKFQFYITYMNDGDDVLPLKVSWSKLISA